MGRTKLYNTDEERTEAQRKYCRESYHRHKAENAEKYRLRAKRRYYVNKLDVNDPNPDIINKINEIDERLKQINAPQAQNSENQDD